jgi:hypothetical protein
MASIILRGERLYAKIKDADGKWQRVRTSFFAGQESKAKAWADALEVEVAESAKLRKHAHPSFYAYVQRKAEYPSTRDGWVYAIALDPSVHPFTVKVGYTSKHVAHRLRKYHTTSPLAVVVGIWDARKHDEPAILCQLPGRIGLSEVFVTADVEQLLKAIDGLMGART